MIHHDWDLFYDVFNTITEHNLRQILPFIDSKLFWYLFLSESKSYFIASSASSLIMISMLSIFECITPSSSLSMEEITLFAIVNWIFLVSNFLRFYIKSFKYGPILLRYSSTDNVLFPSPLLLYQYNCYSKNCLLWLVYNNFVLLLHA